MPFFGVCNDVLLASDTELPFLPFEFASADLNDDNNFPLPPELVLVSCQAEVHYINVCLNDKSIIRNN